MEKSSESLIFTEEELEEINSVRKEYEILSDREKFVLKEALLPYFSKK